MDAFSTAMQLTDKGDINKADGNIESLPNTTPVAKYMAVLKDKMKAGRLYNKLLRWFREKKKLKNSPTDSLVKRQNYFVGILWKSVKL